MREENNKMKKDYLKPEIDFINVEKIDIITTSDYIEDEDELPLIPA